MNYYKILLLAIFLSPVLFCDSPLPRPVFAKVVRKADAGLVRRFPATVRPLREATLSFRVPGILAQVFASEGDSVQAGQLLAQLDQRDYSLKEKELQARMRASDAELSQMRTGARTEDISILLARLASAESAYETARLDHERFKGLLLKEAVTQSEVDRVHLTLTQSHASLDAARRELQKARSGSRVEEVLAKEAEADALLLLLKQSQAALADTSLVAPFLGIVTNKMRNTHEHIQAGQPLFKIMDLSELELTMYVPEPLLNSIQVGTAVTVICPALSLRIPAQVDAILPQSSEGTQSWPLRVRLPNPEHKILSGMTVEIEVLQTDTPPGIPIPLSSLIKTTGSDKTQVFRIRPSDSTLELVTVTAGSLWMGDVLILEGLNEGDSIVTAGLSWLSPGMKVKMDLRTLVGQ